jgi:Mce-associated membrane protein
MSEDKTPSTAAEIRALAEEAEAEAAEAEALAAAARARVRALQLRRKAELAEAAEEDTKEDKATQELEVPEEAEATAEDQADVEETVQAQVQEPPSENEPKDSLLAAEIESVETEESPGDATAESETESDADVADEDAEEPAPKVRKGRRWRRRPKWSTVTTVLAVLLILAALSGSVYMVKHHRDTVRRRQQVAEFAAAARQGVVTLTSLNFNNAKQDIQRIVDDSTGTFRDDLLKMADDFNKVVEQSKVVEQGTVQAAAVDLESMTNDSAVVYVASTSEVTNAAGAKQDPRNYRLIVTVTRDGDQLKLSKVEFVP